MHVIAATYPTTMRLNVAGAGLTQPRVVGGYTELYQSGQSANITLTSDQQYTGNILHIR